LTTYWFKEALRLVAFAGVGMILDGIFDQGPGFLILSLLLFIAWHGVRLRRLARWLMYRNQPDPEFGNDIWGELYYQVQRRKARARKRERKLKGMIRRYRESSSAMPDAAVVLRADNTIEWMNDAAAPLLGLRAGADLGSRIDNLVRHPDFVRFLRSGKYEEGINLLSPVDEDRTMEIHIVPYGHEQRLLVARDITRMHQLEVMRRDFVANVSHELSTPLTVISGYLEKMADSPPSPERLVKPVMQMREQTERMRQLVSDLLQLSRLETDAAEPEEIVDVAPMIRRVVNEVSQSGGGNSHRFELRLADAILLSGVSRDLYTAFSNLVRNAAQYTPEGGTITVRWGDDNGGARLDVEDTGIGIPAAAIPRLTERFYRVDAGRSRRAGGTGLGLSIVKHVLRQHQATLKVKSVVDKGSTFSCLFPEERVERRDPAAMSEGGQQADAAGKSGEAHGRHHQSGESTTTDGSSQSPLEQGVTEGGDHDADMHGRRIF
jgi:two-component system phosphate regulon sensor histidine kinase PhoR